MSANGLAFFDDYPNEDRGHHPELILGLARAAAAISEGVTHVHCPPPYLDGAALPGSLAHHPCEGPRPYAMDASRDNLRRACRASEAGGATTLVNLFLDQNYRSFPLPESPRLRLVHALHRPGPGPRGPRSPRANLDRLLADRPDDLVLVYTSRGLELAAELVPRRNLARLGWPAATSTEVESRFAASGRPADEEPYVLMVGGAREDKGIGTLLAAMENGPPLRIVGEQAPSIEATLRAAAPRTRVEWEGTWVPRRRIDEAIAGAGAVVFPYEDAFGAHGGASGALAQAMAHPKPIVLSTVLAEQATCPEGCLAVPPGESRRLRAAIDRALGASAELHAEALGRREYALREHTYEGHVEGLAALLEGDPAPVP